MLDGALAVVTANPSGYEVEPWPVPSICCMPSIAHTLCKIIDLMVMLNLPHDLSTEQSSTPAHRSHTSRGRPTRECGRFLVRRPNR